MTRAKPFRFHLSNSTFAKNPMKPVYEFHNNYREDINNSTLVSQNVICKDFDFHAVSSEE